MPAEVKKEIELEIAHVLFLDIVGYSKLSVNEQHARVDELNGIVRLSEQFQKAEAANRILKIPTGDGMALVFYKSPEEPAQCAFEISRALKDNQRLQVRMGIHSGPVSGVVDVNERTNVAGAGINLAQRVMDCGDAGHILLSHHVAEDLAEYERWRPFLHDIGTFEVKHGVRVSVTNLYSDEVGNPNLPSKLQAVQRNIAPMCVGRQWRSRCWCCRDCRCGSLFFAQGPARSLATAVEKSIAVLPFENLSERKSERLLHRWRAGRNPDQPGEDRGSESDQPHLSDAVQERRCRAICARSASNSAWRMSSKAVCSARPTKCG